jgi:hypothetical protein
MNESLMPTSAPEQRHEEDQAEQQPPEAAAERAALRGIAQLAGLRLRLPGFPADHGRVLHRDELLSLQGLQLVEGRVGTVGRGELPDGQR